ncbi:MAG TPA: sensor histidine kinase [Lachnospiraceae bacterium]|nr:sensor histidine kinase [Lachnospiraceae bacterium]
MELILCIIALAAATLLLLVRSVLIDLSLKEIEKGLAARLDEETNTLLDIPGRSRSVRRLAAALNVQLRRLRDERRRFQSGDQELKDAVTNISHDLRTPLTAIFGYLELLKRENTSGAAARYLSQIEDRAEAMKQLTDELLSYSVASSGEPARLKLDLGRALEESLLSFYGAMEQRKLTPEIRIADEPVWRYLDPGELGRIFGNVISNALKYSAGDFSVSMDTDGTITFSNTAPQLNAVTVGRLFDRFYTVRDNQNSTGLGLSIARLLTERMGGTIGADYREGKLLITVAFPEQRP